MRILLTIFILFSGTNAMAEEVVFRQDIYIKSTKEKLWEALTNQELINRYYMLPIVTLGTNVGDTIEYGAGDQIMISGTVLSFEKEKSFSHTFVFGPSEKDSLEETVSRVTYNIEEQNGLLTLSLIHDGFKTKNQTYYDVAGGWPYILSNLKTLLETGKTLTEK